MSQNEPKPPQTYDEFTAKFPLLKSAWEAIAEAGKHGPFDDKTRRLLKLALAAGAMREGAFRSGVRKAMAMGISEAEIAQVIALSAGVLGIPSTVAVFSWWQDVVNNQPK